MTYSRTSDLWVGFLKPGFMGMFWRSSRISWVPCLGSKWRKSSSYSLLPSPCRESLLLFLSCFPFFLSLTFASTFICTLSSFLPSSFYFYSPLHSHPPSFLLSRPPTISLLPSQSLSTLPLRSLVDWRCSLPRFRPPNKTALYKFVFPTRFILLQRYDEIPRAARLECLRNRPSFTLNFPDLLDKIRL